MLSGAGVYVDKEMLLEQSAELQDGMARIEAEAHEIAGEVFNIGSPKQIQGILFDKLGLPVISKTPKGQPSTAEIGFYRKLAHDYPLPRLILDYRSMSKLKIHVHRQAAARNQPDNRAHPHQLPSGRGGHRAFIVVGSEFCRIFQSGRRKGGVSARLSWRHPAGSCWPRIIPRSNYASWLTCRRTTG